MSNSNRQFRLAARPQGLLAPGDLQFVETPIPPVADGQALARVRYLSMDPTMRIWMADVPQYMPPVAFGDVMRCLGLAEVMESRHSRYKKGDKLVGLTGLQDYLFIDGTENRPYQKVPPVPFMSDTAFLGVLGVTGLTAYFGMMDIAKPQPGETLVVSAAAGGSEKCKWLTDGLGFDAGIDYKRSDWKNQLAAATPKGIDINFENVGGEIMNATLARMNLHGRVVLCGLISGYTKEQPSLASFGTVLIKSLRIQGFIISDYADKFAEGISQLGKWKAFGKLKDRETIVEGLEKVPDAINMLFTGGNIGKLIVKL